MQPMSKSFQQVEKISETRHETSWELQGENHIYLAHEVAMGSFPFHLL